MGTVFRRQWTFYVTKTKGGIFGTPSGTGIVYPILFSLRRLWKSFYVCVTLSGSPVNGGWVILASAIHRRSTLPLFAALDNHSPAQGVKSVTAQGQHKALSLAFQTGMLENRCVKLLWGLTDWELLTKDTTDYQQPNRQLESSWNPEDWAVFQNVSHSHTGLTGLLCPSSDVIIHHRQFNLVISFFAR